MAFLINRIAKSFKPTCFRLLVVGLFLPIQIFAQSLELYQLYNTKGREISFQKLFKEASDADVVLFGETHNDATNHWLELQLLKVLTEKHSTKLALGMEMLETDQQLFTNQALDTGSFEAFAKATKLWPNFQTDYQPMLEWAKQKKLSVIASNAPRKLARKVSRTGFAFLSNFDSLAYFNLSSFPIPYDSTLANYKSLSGSGMMHGMSSPFLPQAQAFKDATMAWQIAKALKSGKKVFHINGSYHSKDKEGIIWYLKQYAPNAKVITIHVSSGDTKKPTMEDLKAADFLFQIAEDGPKSY